MIEDYFAQHKSDDEKRFVIYLLLIVLIFITAFYLMTTVEIFSVPVAEKLSALKTTFSIEQEKKKVVPKEITKPIDLGEKPTVSEIPEVTDEPPSPNEDRRVFGLQKVFSTGLGAGGSMSDAVVGKFGNTVNKDFDTISATHADLVAKEVVTSSSVTQAPSFRKRVTPEITEEIRQSGVSGTIRVRVLVDIDGLVKRAVAQNDLGFGTMEAAVAACLQMEFSPAKIGDETVAVWITIPVRFEKL